MGKMGGARGMTTEDPGLSGKRTVKRDVIHRKDREIATGNPKEIDDVRKLRRRSSVTSNSANEGKGVVSVDI